MFHSVQPKIILKPKIIKSVTVSIVSPSIYYEVMGPDAMILVFWMLSFKPTFFILLFHFYQEALNSSSLSTIRVVSSVHLRLLIFLPVILIPACASTSLAFHMMYSACKLNKQGDNIQPWWPPFPIWNQSIVPCSILTGSFLTCLQVLLDEDKVVWYSHFFKNFPQFIVIYTVKGFSVVNEAEVDVFLELSCFFYDPTDVDNLISGSSAFSKSSLNIWKFTVHVLLKPCLENFEHYFASVLMSVKLLL